MTLHIHNCWHGDAHRGQSGVDFVLKSDYDADQLRICALEAALRFCQFYMRDVKFPTDHPMALAISKALTAMETGAKYTGPAGYRSAICEHCGRMFMDHSEDDLSCPQSKSQTETKAEHFPSNETLRRQIESDPDDDPSVP